MHLCGDKYEEGYTCCQCSKPAHRPVHETIETVDGTPGHIAGSRIIGIGCQDTEHGNKKKAEGKAMDQSLETKSKKTRPSEIDKSSWIRNQKPSRKDKTVGNRQQPVNIHLASLPVLETSGFPHSQMPVQEDVRFPQSRGLQGQPMPGSINQGQGASRK